VRILWSYLSSPNISYAGQSFYLQKIRDVLPGFVSTLLTPLNAVSVSHFLDWELRDLVNIVVAAGTIWAAISK
jgi:hypothetical protein